MRKPKRVHSTQGRTASKTQTKSKQAKLGTSPADAVLKLIDDAKSRLLEFSRASEEEAAIRQKIGENNSRRSHVRLPSRFEFAHGYAYGSAFHMEDDVKRIAKQAKEHIAESRRLLKKKGVSQDAAKAARDSIIYWQRQVQERKEGKEWLENVLRREHAHINKLWRTTGYSSARRRLIAAEAAAKDAIKAVSEAKPSTFEGALAMIKYVADRALYSVRKGLPMTDLDAEICAPLYRAHDYARMFGLFVPKPSEALAAVRAEKARRHGRQT